MNQNFDKIMLDKTNIVTLDLEGVLTPEVWISVAEKTGIEDLKLTTRDISDYDELMTHRLSIIKKHGIKIKTIQAIISTLKLLPGALNFLSWLRTKTQVVILSDTFYEFADSFMQKLNYPTLLCHSLIINDGIITGYKLRINDAKTKAVNSFKQLGFYVIAAGDSYNDTGMLSVADKGILFNAPQNVIDEFPKFTVCKEYSDFKQTFINLGI